MARCPIAGSVLAFGSPSVDELNMSHKEIGDRARAERLETIRAELLRRIRPLCMAMPDELFLEMVETMAAIQLKYELTDSVGTG
jgi:hypothetical protein